MIKVSMMHTERTQFMMILLNRMSRYPLWNTSSFYTRETRLHIMTAILRNLTINGSLTLKSGGIYDGNAFFMKCLQILDKEGTTREDDIIDKIAHAIRDDMETLIKNIPSSSLVPIADIADIYFKEVSFDIDIKL